MLSEPQLQNGETEKTNNMYIFIYILMYKTWIHLKKIKYHYQYYAKNIWCGFFAWHDAMYVPTDVNRTLNSTVFLPEKSES